MPQLAVGLTVGMDRERIANSDDELALAKLLGVAQRDGRKRGRPWRGIGIVAGSLKRARRLNCKHGQRRCAGRRHESSQDAFCRRSW